MTDPIERINNANTIKELVDLIKGEAEFFSKDKHDWYECMFGDMAALYNAFADRLSVIDKQMHVDQGCDWRFHTAMTEIYAIAFRPESRRPECATEAIDAIERIAGEALRVEATINPSQETVTSSTGRMPPEYNPDDIRGVKHESPSPAE